MVIKLSNKIILGPLKSLVSTVYVAHLHCHLRGKLRVQQNWMTVLLFAEGTMASGKGIQYIYNLYLRGDLKINVN